MRPSLGLGAVRGGDTAHFVTRAAEAVAAQGQFTVALSGGSTPRSTYALLARREFARRVDWPRVHVFWGDERCVPPDHPDSNYRMAREVLLEKVPIPIETVHRIQGELPPDQAAAAYRAELELFLGAGGRFDLILPTGGQLLWLVDAGAAAHLERR